jgi:hypothetical protein
MLDVTIMDVYFKTACVRNWYVILRLRLTQNITKDAAAMVEAIRRMQKLSLRDSLIKLYILSLRIATYNTHTHNKTTLYHSIN